MMISEGDWAIFLLKHALAIAPVRWRVSLGES